MTIDPLTTFLDALKQAAVLSPERLEEFALWAMQSGTDAQTAARELVNRGWLTPFQVKQVWKGHGHELNLGQYLLIEKLGEGGMGEVYKARHRRMDREVALKIIRKERLANPDSIRRFRSEITLASKLQHPNVVMAYDADQVGDTHFFAMEFVDGVTLSALVKERGPLPIPEACDLIRQAALGLQHAYEQGLVHRDIKPSNLLVTKRGNQVKILDMGLARMSEGGSSSASSRITQEGLVLGTPDFLAPEQARNAREADIRADLYALGCTFFFILTGQVPFPGGTPTEKLLRHSMDPPPSVMALRPDVPPQLGQILLRLLAKKPEDRLQTPIDLANALTPFCVRPGTGVFASVSSGVQAVPIPYPQQPPSSGITGTMIPQPTVVPTQGPVSPPLMDVIAQLTEPASDPSSHNPFRLSSEVRQDSIRPTPPKNSFVKALIAAGVLVAGIVVGLLLLKPWKRGEGPIEATPPQEETELLVKLIDMPMVLIKPGRFRMGSPADEPGRSESEGPARDVEISYRFYMAKTEVTQRQYRIVQSENPSKFARDGDKRPVENVSWSQAREFCRKLNESERPRDKMEFRLPTEAEWEYACRAGSNTAFTYGNELKPIDHAVFNDPDIAGAIAEASDLIPQKRRANAWGLFDMHGNVWEWCQDNYDERYYSSAPSKDPTGPKSSKRRVLRGGGWSSTAAQCRSAARRGETFDFSAPDIGFRVVLAPKP